MTGIRAVFSLCRSAVSRPQPSITGIMMSTTSRSGGAIWSAAPAPPAVRGAAHLVAALALQDHAHDLLDVGLVVHDDHELGAAVRRARSCSHFCVAPHRPTSERIHQHAVLPARYGPALYGPRIPRINESIPHALRSVAAWNPRLKAQETPESGGGRALASLRPNHDRRAARPGHPRGTPVTRPCPLPAAQASESWPFLEFSRASAPCVRLLVLSFRRLFRESY